MLEERPAVRRRIMMVIGESQDSGSESRLGEVLRQAQLANVTIYSVGLSTAMADLRAKPDHVNDTPDLLALAVVSGEDREKRAGYELAGGGEQGYWRIARGHDARPLDRKSD